MRFLNSKLKIENTILQNIAKKYGTPAYCYSYKQLRENINDFKKNFKSISPLICFAIKSNTNLNLIKEIKKFGLGADVVSMGELMLALKAGISPKKIVFSGVGKTSKEINFAIDKNILLINSESKSEIIEIDKIAKIKKKQVNIGIRLNPNTDAKTLSQISTGKKDNKFGVNDKTFFELVKYCKSSRNINLRCLSVHIGSQILDHKPYLRMIRVIENIIKKSKNKFDYIDLGGGMGIDYGLNSKKLNYKKYSSSIESLLKKYKVKFIFEPGRSIIGDTACLITKVIYVKSSTKKNFIILDSAMNDFMRPALYGSLHRIIPTVKNNKILKKVHDFVGPICETTDRFLTLKKYQQLKENDTLAICDVGAYGIVLASNYNLRPKPAEVLINNSSLKIISKRENINKII